MFHSKDNLIDTFCFLILRSGELNDLNMFLDRFHPIMKFRESGCAKT